MIVSDELMQNYNILKGYIGKEMIRLTSNNRGDRIKLGNFIENFKVTNSTFNGKPIRPVIIKDIFIDKSGSKIVIYSAPIDEKYKRYWKRDIVSASNIELDKESKTNFFISYETTKNYSLYCVTVRGFFSPGTPLDKYRYDDEFRQKLKEIKESQSDFVVPKFEEVVVTKDNIKEIFLKLNHLRGENKKYTVTIKSKLEKTPTRVNLKNNKIVNIIKSDSDIVISTTNGIISNTVLLSTNATIQFYTGETKLKIFLDNGNIGFDIRLEE
jgi:hypothetical protein